MATNTFAPDPSSLSQLEIRLFGEPAVLHGGQLVEVPKRQATRLLLYYLVLFPGTRVRRDYLVFLLWPDVGNNIALARLRRSLHRLRRYLESLAGTAHWIHADKFSVALLPDETIIADVWRIDSSYNQLLAVSGNSKALLSELEFCCLVSRAALISNHSAEWIEAVRETYRIRRQRLMSSLVRIAHEFGDLDRAVVWAHERAYQGDLSEIAFQELMSIQLELGDRIGAQHSYHYLCNLLQERFGMDPDNSTVQIIKAAKSHLAESDVVAIRTQQDAVEFSMPAVAIGNSYIDWGDNLSRLHSLLESHRLVAISGPGGVGKTRLSAEYSNFHSGALASRIFYVDVDTHPPEHTLHGTIARLFGGRANSVSECVEVVRGSLDGVLAIIILDHCDHVMSDASDIAAGLVDSANNLSSIIISRSCSQLESFGHLAISPMDLPAGLAEESYDELRAHCTLTLFAQRADPPLEIHSLSEKSLREISSIIRYVGGLPLGIELAAAYTSILEVQDLHAALLSDSIRLINLDRLAAPHHDTLWRMLDWGFQALTPTAQLLLCVASLFSDGISSKTALEMCAGVQDTADAHIDQAAESTLATLIKQHLIRSYNCECGARVKLDPIVRDFSKSTKLFASAAGALERTFVQHYISHLEGLITHVFDQETAGPPCVEVHELVNICEAMRLIHSHEDGEYALRLASALWRYWYSRGHHTHERKWVTDCLSFMDHSVGQLGLSRMNSIAGVLCYGESMYAPALEHFSRAADGFRESQAFVDLAECLQRQALTASALGDLSLATRACSEAVAIHRSLVDSSGLVDSLSILGSLFHASGHSLQAIRVHTTCLTILYNQEAPNYKKLSACLGLGTSSLRLGLLESAGQSLLRAQAIASAIGSKAHLASIYDNLGQLARRSGDYYLAREHFGRSLALSSSTGEHYTAAVTYCNLGEACLENGSYDEARLFLTRSLEIAEHNHHTQLVCYALSALCELECIRLDHKASSQMASRLGAIAPSDARPHLRAVVFRARGLCSLLSSHYSQGLQYLYTSLEVCRRIYDPFEFSRTLQYIGMAIEKEGNSRLALIALSLHNSILNSIPHFDSISGLPPVVSDGSLDSIDIALISATIPLANWSEQIDTLFDLLAQQIRHGSFDPAPRLTL